MNVKAKCFGHSDIKIRIIGIPVTAIVTATCYSDESKFSSQHYFSKVCGILGGPMIAERSPVLPWSSIHTLISQTAQQRSVKSVAY